MPAIMKTPLHDQFANLQKSTLELGEAADCSVKALALITGKTYAEAHEALRLRGRVNRQGIHNSLIIAAAEDLGTPMVQLSQKQRYQIIQSYPHQHYKLKSITTHHPRRFPLIWENAPDCLLFSSSHVAAYVNGAVVDWSVNNALRVRTAYYRQSDAAKMMEFIEYVKSVRQQDALDYWQPHWH